MLKVTRYFSRCHLVRAKNDKNDEYYTTLLSIEQEVPHYSFRNKTVYCNCDDLTSNFVIYFMINYYNLGLKRLIVTGIGGYFFKYDGKTMKKRRINGDFRSAECRRLLQEADIVVTNPPFSLFREFMRTLIGSGVKFLVIGPKTAISYKDVFPYLANGMIRFGYSIPNEFLDLEGNTVKLTGLSRWFTNLDSDSPKTIRLFTATYHPSLYQQFDYYPAINVDRTEDIPCDYDGHMGVPITALEQLDFNQYEVVDMIARYAVLNHTHDTPGHQLTEVNGKPKFSRLIIRKKNIVNELKNVS